MPDQSSGPKDGKRFLSTGEAAERLGVKADTVLKWVRQGRVASWTTAGGHHRIDVFEVERIRESGVRRRQPSGSTNHCWEYFARDGAIREACTRCIVYRSRAERCFELAVAGSGHEHVHCSGSCEACPFYRHANGLPQRILVVTSNQDFMNRLRLDERDTVEIRFAADAYTASTAVGALLPGIVVVDRSLPQGEWQALVHALENDDRVPWVRVVVADPAGSLDVARLAISGTADPPAAAASK